VTSDSVVLSDSQQLELSRITQSRSLPAGYVFRARLILMLAKGAAFSTIKRAAEDGTKEMAKQLPRNRMVCSSVDWNEETHDSCSKKIRLVLVPSISISVDALLNRTLQNHLVLERRMRSLSARHDSSCA
jgi:hypothetical protein